MKTLIFPGQGSQIVGMGKDLYNKFDLVKKIFLKKQIKIKLSNIKNNTRRARK